MAATVTWEALRELAGFTSAHGCAFSLFLDLDPSTTPTPAGAEARLRSLLARAEKEFANGDGRSHDEKMTAGRDLERIRTWWSSEFERDGARGVAIFVSGADGLWRVLPLPRAVTDDVHLGRRLRLTPLVELAGDGDGAFVAIVNRERGQVYQLRSGRLEEIVDRSEEQPGQHDQGGWSQARFQRHLDKLVAEHLKSGGRRDRPARAARAGAAARDRRARGAALRDRSRALGRGARGARRVGKRRGARRAGRAARGRTTHLDHARAARVEEAVERWREEHGKNGRASAGWADTLAAASDGRVELLLLGDGAGHRAFRCPECGRGQATAELPTRGAELEPRGGADLAVQQTLTQGGVVAARARRSARRRRRRRRAAALLARQAASITRGSGASSTHVVVLDRPVELRLAASSRLSAFA